MTPTDIVIWMILILLLLLLLLLLFSLWRFMQRPPLANNSVVLYDTGRDSITDQCGGGARVLYGPNLGVTIVVNVEVWRDPQSCSVKVSTGASGVFLNVGAVPRYRAALVTLLAGDSISYECANDGIDTMVCDFRIRITRI